MKAYGILHGGGINQHFVTEDDRNAAAMKLQANIEAQYARKFKYAVLDVSSTMKQIVNIKKNGKPGAIRYAIVLYSFERAVCSYLNCCAACNALRHEQPR